jgi:hypothetical protein
MKAFRLDGSYDIQVQCTIMFCAGPNGCPPSNCLDSGTNDLFISHGRRKRSLLEVEQSEQTAETLSAIIRVLAEGEEESEAEKFYNNTSGFVNRNVQQREEQRIELDSLVCMADEWFVSMVASMSLLCLMLSTLIVIWGCSSLRAAARKLPA